MASLSESLGIDDRHIFSTQLHLVTRDSDIGDSIQCLRYYAGWADKITGQVYFTVFRLLTALTDSWQTIEVDNKTKLAFTRHDPIGVCGQMSVPTN
jgi:aldehyde dehydrogenase (NAD+)